MSKLEFPKFSDPPTSSSVHAWIGRCDDTVEAWQALNPDKVLATRTIITLAGLKLEEPEVATWWNENRDDLKKLASWDLFAQKLKERFVPTNWRMDALASFYAIRQDSSSFPDFTKTLQRARNALASAGAGFSINDPILKNHLLFNSHPVLRLRVCGQQDFPYADMKVDALIANMSATWASLLAEGIIKLRPTPAALAIPPVLPPSSSSTTLPTPTSASSSTPRFSPLTYAEKEALRAAQGCYHCRKTPQSPGWVKHRSDSCPGDSALGIPPRNSPAVVAAVGPVGFSGAYEEGYAPVAAVFPAYDPEDDSSFSSATDSDLDRSY
ncbi:hypothetical protein C8J57DRAFT_1614652 [Mycena rebaudengoi]|nr:hypothetical protein C8J57DRAFT_1614652 [Mycena rebaudengoi]